MGIEGSWFSNSGNSPQTASPPDPCLPCCVGQPQVILFCCPILEHWLYGETKGKNTLWLTLLVLLCDSQLVVGPFPYLPDLFLTPNLSLGVLVYTNVMTFNETIYVEHLHSAWHSSAQWTSAATVPIKVAGGSKLWHVSWDICVLISTWVFGRQIKLNTSKKWKSWLVFFPSDHLIKWHLCLSRSG
jgi:hypothetical protein